MSGLPTSSKSINGREYETTLLDAKTARHVFLRLVKVLGSGAREAGEKVSKGTWAAFVAGATGALERLTDDDLTYFVDTFGPVSTVQLEGGARANVKDIYPIHFAGKMKEHTEWLLFCFETNYADFFDGARSQLAEIWDLVKASIVSDSSSPTESIGGSGDSLPIPEPVVP